MIPRNTRSTAGVRAAWTTGASGLAALSTSAQDNTDGATTTNSSVLFSLFMSCLQFSRSRPVGSLLLGAQERVQSGQPDGVSSQFACRAAHNITAAAALLSAFPFRSR